MTEQDLVIQDLRAENTKLSEELEAYRQLEQKMYEKFQGHINTETIVNSFIDFYDMHEVNEELAECLLITNEDVKKYKKYQRLEEQGLLLKLPCKVGTQVFIINHYWIDEGFICGIAEADDIDCFCFKVYEDPDTYTLIAIDDFEKGWFLTEQEAQSALEEMKGE